VPSSPDLGEEGRELPLRWSTPPPLTRGGHRRGSHGEGEGPHGREGARVADLLLAPGPDSCVRHRAAASGTRIPKPGACGHHHQASADAPTVARGTRRSADPPPGERGLAPLEHGPRGILERGSGVEERKGEGVPSQV
jgi:hypothetical protein